MKKIVLIVAALFSTQCLAGVFKCTDASGNTSYQSQPCAEEKQAFEMNVKTGSAVDLNQQQKQEELAEEEKRRLKQEAQQRLLEKEQRKKDTLTESAITQALINSNPKQYSAFAIPPYDPDKLPAIVKQFENRLPEIEKFRRLAAQKALATGECQRVEADELNLKSQEDSLVFLVDCSSGKSFYFNETELADQ